MIGPLKERRILVGLRLEASKEVRLWRMIEFGMGHTYLCTLAANLRVVQLLGRLLRLLLIWLLLICLIWRLEAPR